MITERDTFRQEAAALGRQFCPFVRLCCSHSNGDVDGDLYPYVDLYPWGLWNLRLK